MTKDTCVHSCSLNSLHGVAPVYIYTYICIYLSIMCQAVSDNIGRRSLSSSSSSSSSFITFGCSLRGDLTVQFLPQGRRATVPGGRSVNMEHYSLPASLRHHSLTLTSFCCQLKTCLFIIGILETVYLCTRSILLRHHHTSVTL